MAKRKKLAHDSACFVAGCLRSKFKQKLALLLIMANMLASQVRPELVSLDSLNDVSIASNQTPSLNKLPWGHTDAYTDD